MEEKTKNNNRKLRYIKNTLELKNTISEIKI